MKIIKMRNEIAKRLGEALNQQVGLGIAVFSNRRLPLALEHLPCVVLSTDEESWELFNQAPRIFKKTAELSVEVLSLYSQEVQSKNHLIYTCVEDALVKLHPHELLVHRITPKMNVTQVSIQGEKIIECMKWLLQVEYFIDDHLNPDTCPYFESQKLTLVVPS